MVNNHFWCNYQHIGQRESRLLVYLLFLIYHTLRFFIRKPFFELWGWNFLNQNQKLISWKLCTLTPKMCLKILSWWALNHSSHFFTTFVVTLGHRKMIFFHDICRNIGSQKNDIFFHNICSNHWVTEKWYILSQHLS